MNFGDFPIALIAVVLLVPVIYSAVWKRESLKKTLALWVLSVVLVLLYPLVIYASNNGGNFGYFLAKLVIFVFLPLALLMFMEKWTARTAFVNVGVRRMNLEKSVAYGLIVAVITITLSVSILLATNASSNGVDAGWATSMFLDAFTEEFLFRGVFFLYLMTLIDWRVAAVTSITAFVLMHSQYFIGALSLFIIVTIVQAILLTWVAYKTRNIIGTWISHGLNRIVPQLVLIGRGS